VAAVSRRGDGRSSAPPPRIASPAEESSGFRAIDPRAVRAMLGAGSSHAGLDPLVLEPPTIPLAPAPRAAGRGILGGVALSGDGRGGGPAATGSIDARPDEAGIVLAAGEPLHARLTGRSGPRAVLVVGEGDAVERHAVLLVEPEASASTPDGVVRREVVVGGWRVEVELESERRAALRERASHGRKAAVRGGPTEVHAIIPGRVVSVSVAAGDEIVADQQLLVVEAMKMQNELHAPRDGRIERVGVAAGDTIEVGDLLLVIV
jgi:biotin carboxyl carrier protein